MPNHEAGEMCQLLRTEIPLQFLGNRCELREVTQLSATLVPGNASLLASLGTSNVYTHTHIPLPYTQSKIFVNAIDTEQSVFSGQQERGQTLPIITSRDTS